MDIELLNKYNNLYSAEERKFLVAEMLKALRESNKLQKKQVAEYLGIKPQTYGAYESGRNETPIEILVRLSFLYEVSIDMIVQSKRFDKSEKTTLEILEMYDSEIDRIKSELLSGDGKSGEKIADSLKEIVEMMKKIAPKGEN